MSSNPPQTPSYRLSSAPGKNRGLFATRPISTGELIVAESPLFLAETAAQILRCIDTLNAEEKALFFELTDNYHSDSGSTPLGIFRTNVLPVDGDQGGIFPIISRFNHSCTPNAYYSWSDPTQRLLIHAIADIPEGAEIGVSYLTFAGIRAREIRQSRISSQFSFACQCPACSGPIDGESDARREKIYALDRLIEIKMGMGDSVGALRLLKERLRLRDEEGLNDLAGRSHDLRDIFQVTIAYSDFDTARRHIAQAYANRVLCDGPDGDFTQIMLQLYQNPRKHPLAGMKRRVMLMPAICDRCGKEEAGGFKVKKSQGGGCGECHCALYCSRSCKEAHAARHKAVCAVLQKSK